MMTFLRSTSAIFSAFWKYQNYGICENNCLSAFLTYLPSHQCQETENDLLVFKVTATSVYHSELKSSH